MPEESETPARPPNKKPRVWPLALCLILAVLFCSPIFKPIPARTIELAYASKLLADARDIAHSLGDFAEDAQGRLPEPARDSNEALNQLFEQNPKLKEAQSWNLKDKVFCLPDRPTENKSLAPGENHWAYVAGLTEHSPPKTPVLADGFTAPDHRYDKRHVFWKQKWAIVAYLDGTVERVTLKIDGDTAYVPAPNGGNLFAPENLPPGAVVLNPAMPSPSEQ